MVYISLYVFIDVYWAFSVVLVDVVMLLVFTISVSPCENICCLASNFCMFWWQLFAWRWVSMVFNYLSFFTANKLLVSCLRWWSLVRSFT